MIDQLIDPSINCIIIEPIALEVSTIKEKWIITILPPFVFNASPDQVATPTFFLGVSFSLLFLCKLFEFHVNFCLFSLCKIKTCTTLNRSCKKVTLISYKLHWCIYNWTQKNKEKKTNRTACDFSNESISKWLLLVFSFKMLCDCELTDSCLLSQNFHFSFSFWTTKHLLYHTHTLSTETENDDKVWQIWERLNWIRNKIKMRENLFRS